MALGRSVVREPKVFLMDEPLSNLDARLRVNMRTELIKLHRQLGATIVYVTHDQSEAMTMATRVAIMRNGVIQQLAPPLEVYRHPANKYVATFMGNPEMNFIEVTSDAHDDALGADQPDDRICRSRRTTEHCSRRIRAITSGSASVPKRCPSRLPAWTPLGIPAVVDVVSPMGPNTLVYVLVDGASIVADVSSDIEPAESENVKLTFEEESHPPLRFRYRAGALVNRGRNQDSPWADSPAMQKFPSNRGYARPRQFGMMPAR